MEASHCVANGDEGGQEDSEEEEEEEEVCSGGLEGSSGAGGQVPHETVLRCQREDYITCHHSLISCRYHVDIM